MTTTGTTSTLPTGNRLLDALGPLERARIATEVDEVQLEMKVRLCEAGGRIDSVYFPLSAVVSMLNDAGGSGGVEIATIGNEGMVGVSLSWDATNLNPAEVLQVQVPGRALRMDAEVFKRDFSQGNGLTDVIHRYTQAFFSQLSQQVACNGLHSVEERCARWLLLTHDRVGSDDFPITQEFLAQMLGVRRPSVTVVAGILQQAGFIRYRRGRIQITDRAGLEESACECYAVLREVFDRLIP
jgi:CRP-like cAMP-binding protein